MHRYIVIIMQIDSLDTDKWYMLDACTALMYVLLWSLNCFITGNFHVTDFVKSRRRLWNKASKILVRREWKTELQKIYHDAKALQGRKFIVTKQKS